MSKRKVYRDHDEFLSMIRSYEYLHDNGRMDLEAFCVNLWGCFAYDGIKNIAPNPQDIFDLLLFFIEKCDCDEEKKNWVQRQKLVDWTPEFSSYYPDGSRTYIHVSALIFCMHRWIFEIGHTLMDISPDKEIPQYYSWVNKDWECVYAFINGFHNFMADLITELDRKSADDRGFSLLEALHISSNSDVQYDDAIVQIKQRSQAHADAISKVDAAIDQKFYLEAIALQECVIRNCLYNFIKSKGKGCSSNNLYQLINVCYKINGFEEKDLLQEVDDWRKVRNKSIHGFVEAKSISLAGEHSSFEELSESAARKGRDLCKRVCEWYLDEAVRFQPLYFDREN